MENYFKKIDLNLGNIDVSLLKGNFFEAYGPTFNSYHINDQEYFNNLINNKIEFLIKPNWVNFTEITEYGAYPHIDHSQTVLNYYIEANSYTTIFYKLKHQVDTEPMYQTRQDGKLIENRTRSYSLSDCIPISTFSAKSNEAYLINIRQIHSATRLIKGPPRLMIRWLWENEDFNSVLDSIKVL